MKRAKGFQMLSDLSHHAQIKVKDKEALFLSFLNYWHDQILIIAPGSAILKFGRKKNKNKTKKQNKKNKKNL